MLFINHMEIVKELSTKDGDKENVFGCVFCVCRCSSSSVCSGLNVFVGFSALNLMCSSVRGRFGTAKVSIIYK